MYKYINIYLYNISMYSEYQKNDKIEKREIEEKKPFWVAFLETLPLFKFHWALTPFS